MDDLNNRHIHPDPAELEEKPRARANGDTPLVRNCLGCEKPFESEGWHNRLCPQCRKR